jgi:hypothetical protein
LVAAKPQGENIVAYGPFIGDTSEDINLLNQEYRRGRMRHVSTIPETQRVVMLIGVTMNFLLEIKLRQEAARKYNPVTETKKYERIIKRRMKRKRIFLINK